MATVTGAARPRLLSSSDEAGDRKKNDDGDHHHHESNNNKNSNHDGLSSEPSEDLNLRIRCTSPGSFASPDYEVATRSTASVCDLKDAVRDGMGPFSRGRYLRLIAGGRLLAPDTAPLSRFKVKDGDCVHAVLAAAGVRGGMQAAMARGLAVSDGRTSSTSTSGAGDEDNVEDDEDDHDGEEDLEEGRERLGFDRLRANGLSRDEIGAIRLYFSANVDRFAEERGITVVNEDRRARLRLEDAWMETQGRRSEFRLNLNSNNALYMAAATNGSGVFMDDATMTTRRGLHVVGTDRDFLWGFFLGFFVGYVMLFWVWLPTVPHKQKLGILTGISLNVVKNMVRTEEKKVFEGN